MIKHAAIEVKVGLFIFFGVTLLLAALLVLGKNSLFSGNKQFHVHLNSADGLAPGGRVTLGGVSVGTIERLRLDVKNRNSVITIAIDPESSFWIRQDSTIQVATQGILGDKYLEINMGTADSPAIASGGEIPLKESKDLSLFLNKGDQLLISLNHIATNLEHVVKSFESEHRSETLFRGLAQTAQNFSELTSHLNKEVAQLPLKKITTQLTEILEKVNNGNGTVGELLNDPSLYDQITALVGGANRNRIVRNLIRQTLSQAKPATTPEK